LIKIFSKVIASANSFSEEQELEVEYALRVIIFEAIKFIGVIAILSVLGYPLQGFLAMIMMALSKPFIGGYHEDNQVKCFLFTMMIIGSVVYLSNAIRLDLIGEVLLGGFSVFCIWNQAPVVHPEMRLTKVEFIKRNRKVGIFIIAAQYIISLILYRQAYISNIIIWVIIFQALLMFNKKKDINLGES
jgi:Membrane protein putatively involved in post-translational modification of the autoinducing quorum-sensing peptide